VNPPALLGAALIVTGVIVSERKPRPMEAGLREATIA
jgi:hypothetical protein